MNSAAQLYIITLLVYFFVDLMACWGLDLQFGVSGVLNFAFIVFQAAGAYTTAVLTLGPSSGNGGFQHYIGGGRLPFPLPLLAAMVVGVLLSLVVGFIGLRRLRSDYQAMVMLVVSVIATAVADSQLNLVNGPAGLSLVPEPLASSISVSPLGYGWLFAAFSGVVCLLVGWLIRRIVESPLGRTLRAIREDERAAAALGRDVNGRRLLVFAIGGAVAALSGGILVEFVGAWAPSGWLYPETFVLFTAIIVGGRANVLGVALGALLIPVGLQQAVQYIPIVNSPTVLASLEWIITGIVTITFLWVRPRGLLPERRRTARTIDRTARGRVVVTAAAGTPEPSGGGS
jgi:ABC-type branched-subunit amino acid transport system permease subunit